MVPLKPIRSSLPLIYFLAVFVGMPALFCVLIFGIRGIVFFLLVASGVASGLALYFIPAILALCRGHHNAMAITVFNFFLGWTFLGWVAALVWACTAISDDG